MSNNSFFFAGGGTGGHIYPAIAVAEQIIKLAPEAKIHFFCSSRKIDAEILTQTDYEYTQLPARGFAARLSNLIGFCTSFLKSYQIAKRIIAESNNAILIGVGGFVAGPVCFAAHRLKVPIVLLNLDVVPGRANKMIGCWADEIFVQFEETVGRLKKSKAKISVVGCPLRSGFSGPEHKEVIEQLGLDRDKKTLLITGASSGSENINKAVCSLLEKLSAFAGCWQIVHLAGSGNYEKVRFAYSGYSDAKIGHKVLRYFDDMPGLLSTVDLVVGRSGAVSVAEYAAASVPSICMPYPYHKDRHQYLNAGKLVEAGAAVIVDDLSAEKDTAERLWEELEELMKDEKKREQMRDACRSTARFDAAYKIAQKLLAL